MGSEVEVNDTLQLTAEQGFPTEVFDLARHQERPVRLEDVAGRVFAFHGKERPRLFHLDPVRVFLVQNIGGKWLFWGKALIQSQQITKRLGPDGQWQKVWETSGTYVVSDVYEPEYQELFTRRESPPGASYFSGGLGK